MRITVPHSKFLAGVLVLSFLRDLRLCKNRWVQLTSEN